MEKILLEIGELLSKMDTVDLISLVACLVSIVGAIISIIMYRLTRKEYKLQLRLYKDGLANFNFQIVECHLKDDKENDKIQYWFNLLILNLSDKQTSIIEYSLTLKCSDGLLYKAEYYKNGSKRFEGIKYLDISQNIDAHNSITGLFFASTFWRKMQNIFGECCISKLEKVARPRLAAILPAT